MNVAKKIGVIVFGMLSITSVSEGREIVISQDGSGEFTTLTEAIKASSEGDILLVQAGEYNEAITLKDRQTLAGQGNVVLSYPDGSTITTSANNVIKNISIAQSGLHAIVGKNVESITIENVELSNFNLMKQVVRSDKNYEFDMAYEAIYFLVSGETEATISLNSLNINDGFGGGIRVISKDTSTVNCTMNDIQVNNIDSSSFIGFPSGFAGSPGFPALGLISEHDSTLTVTIENMDVSEIGDSSDGINASADDNSTLELNVSKFKYDDPTDISGGISEGINIGSNANTSTMNVKVEESDFLNSNNAAFSIFNWNGQNNGVVDLGGGELGSIGMNRFIGNTFHFDGANPIPISAENNYWGNPDGFLDLHLWEGVYVLDEIPYLEDDPRPETSGINSNLWLLF